METEIDVISPLNRTNLTLLDQLFIGQNIVFIITGSIAIIVLSGWLFPVFGSMLPEDWSLMKANTALSIIISVISLKLTHMRKNKFRLFICRVMAFLLLIISGSALFGYLSGHAVWLDTLLAPDIGGEIPGRMAAQTALFFFVMGLIVIIGMETTKKPINYLLDALTALLMTIVLIVIAGYAFHASKLFGYSLYTRTSPHTLFSMTLLLFVVSILRLRWGVFSIFIGMGIGSKIAKILLPFGLLLPFLIVSISACLVSIHWLSQPYAEALTASISSLMLIGLVVMMAWKINGLERDLLDMSLIDELTQIYNRRGFYLLGEHMIREGQRDGTGITVLFFDVDGLKEVNDTLGHDAGSNLLFEFANLLKMSFRRGDVVARVGGDEFAIVSRKTDFGPALKRLSVATEAANNTDDKPYIISYSVGEATTGKITGKESFDEIVSRADALMYEHKQKKKSSHEAVYANKSDTW
jgi:diguanylate cyclase (GGDEF)-like protein